MSEKHESFDGFVVSLYDGKFSGSFDLSDVTAREIGLDDVVTLVVTARVSGAAHSETKVGDVKRTNVFKVSNASVLSPKQASEVLDIVENGPAVPVPSATALGLTPATDAPLAPSSAPREEEEFTQPQLASVGTPGLRVTEDPILARFMDVS